MISGWKLAVVSALAAAAPVRAEGLSCETTSGLGCTASGCEPERIHELRRYPDTAHFQFIVRSTEYGTIVTAAHDALLQRAGADLSNWHLTSQSAAWELPLLLDYGWAYTVAEFPISSYEHCKALAGVPNAQGPVLLDDRLVVESEGAQAQCTSRVVCYP
jgi:hypothetical protein